MIKKRHDDLAFPHITYVRGASGELTTVLRGTRLRVQTIAIATQRWGLSPKEIANEYDLSESQVNEALAFYEAHRQEIDASIVAEQIIEAANV
ncbi:DUF433 domain-containing protein [Microcoleus sp. F10-C6]|uniref:DUF433 domain-containing protein n=1 Tax=unclassified Microcoleus TaxID=2642155 RepID=UPI002FCF76DC